MSFDYKRWLTILAVGSLFIYVKHCEKTKPIKPHLGHQEIQVKAHQVKRVNKPLQIQSFGNLAPYLSSSIRAQINAQITDIHFMEGEKVRLGQTLFTLDPRLNQAQLEAAHASLHRDLAQLDLARFNLKNSEDLFKKGFTTAQDLENNRALLDAALATIEADKASIEVAEVQLSYTKIDAPFDGVCSNTVLKPGNTVQADVTELVTLNQIHPLYVVFNLPEPKAALVRDALAKDVTVLMRAHLPHQPERVFEGKVSSMDNKLNTNNGTIQVKGLIANDDHSLMPGQYVQLSLELPATEIIEIPQAAIERNTRGNYVYLINDKNTIEKRLVELDSSMDDWVLIRKGLKVNETIVSPLNAQLYDGLKVSISP